jgi:hypothetical protein
MTPGPRLARRGFAVYGARFGVEIDEPALLACLPEALGCRLRRIAPRGIERWYRVRAGRRSFSVFLDGTRLARAARREDALAALAADVARHVAETATTRFFVHAGVVGWRGRAIVIPGRSFSGKTTLVAELVRSGATYYSDEYAVFDARGRVHPLPLALNLRDPRRPARRPAAALGGRAGRGPLPVGVVLVTRYRRGARWRPRRLTPGEAAMALLANSVPVRSRPRAAMATLPRAVAGALAFQGTRGEARAVAERVLR